MAEDRWLCSFSKIPFFLYSLALVSKPSPTSGINTDGEVSERCFQESCGRKYDPKSPLILCAYLYMKGNSFQNFTANDQQRQRRLSIENKTIRCIIVAIIAFVVSWSPYCFVSLSSTFKGHAIASPTVSLVPEIMAKASVMYNPIVYLFLNSRFRATLKVLFRRHRVNAVCRQRSLGDCGMYGAPRPKSKMLEISPQSIEDPKDLASIGSLQRESQSSSKASGPSTSSNFVVPLPSVEESNELQSVTAFVTQPVTPNPVHIHFVTVHKSYSDKH